MNINPTSEHSLPKLQNIKAETKGTFPKDSRKKSRLLMLKWI
jgi:hypothetical protein